MLPTALLYRHRGTCRVLDAVVTGEAGSLGTMKTQLVHKEQRADRVECAKQGAHGELPVARKRENAPVPATS